MSSTRQQHTQCADRWPVFQVGSLGLVGCCNQYIREVSRLRPTVRLVGSLVTFYSHPKTHHSTFIFPPFVSEGKLFYPCAQIRPVKARLFSL